MSNIVKTLFRVKRPCENCPFLKEHGIYLEPGRLDGIIESLVKDDYSTFHCHKTVHNEKLGGDWDDEGKYTSSGKEGMCAGAIIYLEKCQLPTVAMRLGRALGTYSPETLKPYFDTIIEP